MRFSEATREQSTIRYCRLPRAARFSNSVLMNSLSPANVEITASGPWCTYPRQALCVSKKATVPRMPRQVFAASAFPAARAGLSFSSRLRIHQAPTAAASATAAL